MHNLDILGNAGIQRMRQQAGAAFCLLRVGGRRARQALHIRPRRMKISLGRRHDAIILHLAAFVQYYSVHRQAASGLHPGQADCLAQRCRLYPSRFHFQRRVQTRK